MSLRLTRPGPARTRLAGLCVAAALVAAAGCDPKPAPGGARGPRADQARAEAQKLAVNAAAAAANSTPASDPPPGVRERTDPVIHTAPPPPPPPAARPAPAPAADRPYVGPPVFEPKPGGSPVVIRERVRSSIPYPTEAEAEEDAVEQARRLLAERLAELPSPVHWTPTASAVRTQYTAKDSRKVRPPGDREQEVLAKIEGGSNRVYVEFQVQVTEDQVREMRSQDRVVTALRAMGGLAAAALAAFLFLRLDEWTRGYLTSWLGAGAAVLVAVVVAAAVLVG
jgi:hypothetical protein